MFTNFSQKPEKIAKQQILNGGRMRFWTLLPFILLVGFTVITIVVLVSGYQP